MRPYEFAGQRLAVRQNGVLFYLHGDRPSATLRAGLGSTSVATTASGAVAASVRYFAYGTPRGSDPAGLPTDHAFAGQKLDRGTGLMYYGARWYDPVIGRFIQADTIVPEPGNPQALNRYSYVLGNPLTSA